MELTIDGYTFDPARTAMREERQEIAGQESRLFRITGMLPSNGDPAAVEAVLDYLGATLAPEAVVDLFLHPGRRLPVRRQKFTREIHADTGDARFEILLRAEQRYEESTGILDLHWTATESGAQYTFEANGTAIMKPAILLQADAVLTAPSITDGVRTITYNAVLLAGAELRLDSVAAQASLDGVDITPYVSGEFPWIGPGTNLFSYTDETVGAFNAELRIIYSERWS